MAYITPEVAIAKLSSVIVQDEESDPATMLLDMALLIEQIEALVDHWLGWHAAATDYKDKLESGELGVFRLLNHPVLQVLSVESYPLTPDAVAEPLEYRWDGSDMFVYARPYLIANIAYRAGLEPLPKVFEAVMLKLLRQCIAANDGLLENASTTAIAGGGANGSEPALKKLVLPGGVTEEYFAPTQLGITGGGADDSGGGAESEIDRLLKPLLGRYRKSLLFG